MQKFLPLLTLAALGGMAQAQTPNAQTLSAQDIVNKVDAAQKAARDVSFRLSGTAAFESSNQKIDLTVKTIPAQNVARVQFAAPDALADNIMVADKNEVRQYMFLTNQITVTPTSKAANNAGIGGLDFNQLGNTSAMLSNYTVKLLSTTGAAGSRVFQLEAAPKNGGTDRTRVWITEAGWRPNRIQLLGQGGKVMADMTISAYKTNAGLTAAALKMLPKDAQIVRQ